MSSNFSQEQPLHTDNETAYAILQDVATFPVAAGGTEYFDSSPVIAGVERQADEFGRSLILNLFVPVQGNLEFAIRYYFFRKFRVA